MTHKNIVNAMIDKATSRDRFRLHGDIILDELESDYLAITGETIMLNRLDGSIVYQVGSAKFYAGAITQHPSTRDYPMIAG